MSDPDPVTGRGAPATPPLESFWSAATRRLGLFRRLVHGPPSWPALSTQLPGPSSWATGTRLFLQKAKPSGLLATRGLGSSQPLLRTTSYSGGLEPTEPAAAAKSAS